MEPDEWAEGGARKIGDHGTHSKEDATQIIAPEGLFFVFLRRAVEESCPIDTKQGR